MSEQAKQTKPLIPAVGYLRKSTNGKKADGQERQEHSIPQQKQEIEKLAQQNSYQIVRWYADPGKSGLKRGKARPDFAKMLNDARTLGDFQAVLCDDFDRFSRASHDEALADIHALKEAGVQYITTVAQGTFKLRDNSQNLGSFFALTTYLWGSHQHSFKHSRRITLARRNRAKEGKRSGGNAPYGMKSNGRDKEGRFKGGLVPGNPAQVKIVRRIFHEFVHERKWMGAIAGGLNRDKVPTPTKRGKAWYTTGIKKILTQQAYVGNFVYNQKQSGQLHIVDATGEVVEATPETRKGNAAIVKKGTHKGIIDQALWDKAQKRLARIKAAPSNRKAPVKHALAGILVCGHCERPMYGCPSHGDHEKVVYRCSSPSRRGTCRPYEVRESLILPFMMNALGQAIDDIKTLLVAPPERLRSPHKEKDGARHTLECKRAELEETIKQGTANLLRIPTDDSQTFNAVLELLATAKKELVQIEEELASLESSNRKGWVQLNGKIVEINEWSDGELQALTDWWDGFYKRAVSVPVPANKTPVEAHLHIDHWVDHNAILTEPLIVNDILSNLGAQVELWWNTKQKTCKSGRLQSRHKVARGRFQLGQLRDEFRFYHAQGKVLRHSTPYTGVYGAGHRAPTIPREILRVADYVFDGEMLASGRLVRGCA